MSEIYRTFFGLSKEAFPAHININQILVTPEVKGVQNRFDYAVRLGCSTVITGDVGTRCFISQPPAVQSLNYIVRLLKNLALKDLLTQEPL